MKLRIFLILVISNSALGYSINNLAFNSLIFNHIELDELVLENFSLDNSSCVASTEENRFQGYAASYDSSEYCSFLGIKYATNERYKEAVPYVSKTKDVNATKDGPQCVQINGDTVVGEEDCLYLSVHTPDVTGSLPVLVWIHGGGFAEGSAVLSQYGPEYYMETKKVVIVLIQYRLGALGFVDFNSEKYPANLGLKDQVEALKWVKKNIASFGGNPDQVTIQGESAGAASVSLHMFSPLSEGLFRAAISESGTACSTWAAVPKEWSRDRLRLLASNVGCDSKDIPDNILEPAHLTADCLKLKTAQQLVNATQTFALPYNGMNSFLPVLERACFKGAFITKYPWSKPMNQVPWISGINSNEAGELIYIMGKMMNASGDPVFNVNISDALYFSYSTSHPEEISLEIKEHYHYDNPVDIQHFAGVTKAVTDGTFAYPNYQCHHVHSGTPSYNYYFNYVASANRNRTAKGVYHAEEVKYFFIQNGFDIRTNGTPQDRDVSKKMVDLWISFVENSVPSSDGIEWDAYDKKTDNIMIVDGSGNFKMGDDPNIKDIIFWDVLPFRELTP